LSESEKNYPFGLMGHPANYSSNAGLSRAPQNARKKENRNCKGQKRK